MTENPRTSAERVQHALAACGVDCQILTLPSVTRTAVEAATAVGCRVEQIVKSLVFKGTQSGTPILVVASGANRVNEKMLGNLAGEPVEKASAVFVRERTGFAIGGVAPLGHTERLTTFIDEDLLQYPEIWAAAGTPHAVFRLTPAELQLMSGGRVVRIS